MTAYVFGVAGMINFSFDENELLSELFGLRSELVPSEAEPSSWL